MLNISSSYIMLIWNHTMVRTLSPTAYTRFIQDHYNWCTFDTSLVTQNKHGNVPLWVSKCSFKMGWNGEWCREGAFKILQWIQEKEAVIKSFFMFWWWVVVNKLIIHIAVVIESSMTSVTFRFMDNYQWMCYRHSWSQRSLITFHSPLEMCLYKDKISCLSKELHHCCGVEP